MAEDLCISNGGKEEKYRMLLPQIKCLIEGEDDRPGCHHFYCS
mgnify:CR=1 FL=1